MIEFPASGVTTYWWLPALVAFVISSVTATGGVSGAFLILPFQISVLGFTGPGSSATNLIYNIVAIPGGLWRFYREKRLIMPLALTIIAGTLPGIFLGALIRIRLLPDPANSKAFAAAVLIYIGARLLIQKAARPDLAARRSSVPRDTDVTSVQFNIRTISFTFERKNHSASTAGLFTLSLIVGIAGGIYGIGGGAIIAPFLVAVFGLPVYAVAGAALLGTFVTSIAGVIFYTVLGDWTGGIMPSAGPDWLLGLSFGLGGAFGIYLGARIQRFLPARLIRIILAAVMLAIALKYALEFISGQL